MGSSFISFQTEDIVRVWLKFNTISLKVSLGFGLGLEKSKLRVWGFMIMLICSYFLMGYSSCEGPVWGSMKIEPLTGFCFVLLGLHRGWSTTSRLLWINTWVSLDGNPLIGLLLVWNVSISWMSSLVC